MDRKIYDDYITKYNSLKLEVIENISELIEKEEYHRFVDPFFIHFVEGEVATTEECTAIECSKGKLFIATRVTNNGRVEETISETDAMGYEFESLLDIYTRLVYELRDERIEKIKQVFCDMDLSTIAVCGNKPIFITMKSGEFKKYFVNTIYLNEDGEVEVSLEKKHSTVSKKISDLALDELDTLLGYIKDATEKEYNVIVSVRLSRPINVKANSWEEACEKAKKMLDEHPLNEKEDGDGNIEVWEN